MKLYELQQNNLDDEIENQLKNVADGMDDQDNQPDVPVHGNMPTGQADENPLSDPSPEPTEDEEREENMSKPIDSGLLSAVQNLPYVSRYNHESSQNTHPMNLLTLDVSDMEKVRNRARNEIASKTMTDAYGLYDDPELRFWQDLVSFMERAITAKRKISGEPAKDVPPPKVQDQAKPKNAAGEWKSPATSR